MKIQRPSKTDLIIALIICIIILIVSKSFDHESFTKHHSGKEPFMPNLHKAYKGTVVNKYVDRKQHNYKTIELKLNDTLEYFHILNGSSELFDYLKIHDSVIKLNFGNEIIVRRNNIDSLFYLDN